MSLLNRQPKENVCSRLNNQRSKGSRSFSPPFLALIHRRSADTSLAVSLLCLWSGSVRRQSLETKNRNKKRPTKKEKLPHWWMRASTEISRAGITRCLSVCLLEAAAAFCYYSSFILFWLTHVQWYKSVNIDLCFEVQVDSVASLRRINKTQITGCKP